MSGGFGVWVGASSDGPGGGAVAVDDDSVEVTAEATRFNFGSGLTATDSGGGAVTVAATGAATGGEDLISEVVLAAAGTITFVVATGYKSLRIEAALRSTRAGSSNDAVQVRLGAGGVIDSGASSYRRSARNDGSSFTAVNGNGDHALPFGVFNFPGATADVDAFGFAECRILNHADTGKRTLLRGQGGFSSSTGDNRWGVGFSEWASKSVVDRILIRSEFGTSNHLAMGSWARLYGIPA